MGWLIYVVLGLPFAFFARKRWGWGTGQSLVAGMVVAMAVWLLISFAFG